MNALSKYKAFHGKEPKGSSPLNFHVPEKLIFLGTAVAIEYKCNKLNGGGDGRMAIYRHRFEEPAIVCMDETGKKQLYIIGKHITVDNEGIKK